MVKYKKLGLLVLCGAVLTGCGKKEENLSLGKLEPISTESVEKTVISEDVEKNKEVVSEVKNLKLLDRLDEIEDDVLDVVDFPVGGQDRYEALVKKLSAYNIKVSDDVKGIYTKYEGAKSDDSVVSSVLMNKERVVKGNVVTWKCTIRAGISPLDKDDSKSKVGRTLRQELKKDSYKKFDKNTEVILTISEDGMSGNISVSDAEIMNVSK